MGVTGSLLAAVAVGFSLTGGVLAFRSWPAAEAPRTAPALEVVQPARKTETGPPLALPAVAVPAPTAGAPAAARIPVAPHRRALAPVRRRSTTRVPQPAAPAPSVQNTAASTAPPAQGEPTPGASPVADAAEATSRGAARSLRGAAQAAAHAAAPAPPAAATVAAVGERGASAVEAVGDAVADAVRDPH